MKIIRKVEDLNGLENEFGLRIKINNGNDLYLQDGNLENIKVGYYNVEESGIHNIIRIMKLMGFKFEWKPKRSLEEVLHSYSTMFFVPNEKNYLILEKDGRYSVSYSFHKSIGTSYYLKKDAEKICEELNS